MQFLVAFIATLACALAAPSGYSGYAASPYPYAAPAYPAYAGGYAYYGPADIRVLPSGYLADTPEVAHAKAAHLVAKSYVAAAAAASPDYGSYYNGYHASTAPYYANYNYAPYTGAYAGGYAYYGPANIRVLPNGYLADTPEVAQAKREHAVAKSYAAVAGAASPDYGRYPHAVPHSYITPHYNYDQYY